MSLVFQQGHINLMARVLRHEALLQEFVVPHDASAFRSVARRTLGPDHHFTWLLGRRRYDPPARSRMLARSLALTAYLRAPGSLRRRLPSQRRVLDPMFDQVIARHLRRARPALLITGPTWGVASLTVARAAGIGTAMMIPDDVWAALVLHERELPPDSPRLADTRALAAINDRAVSQSDIVFAESRQVVDHAVANGGDPARMVVLGQGIDLSPLCLRRSPPVLARSASSL
ncbi:MAG: glycosyltransferase [Tepidiformaceae bacterium]